MREKVLWGRDWRVARRSLRRQLLLWAVALSATLAPGCAKRQGSELGKGSDSLARARQHARPTLGSPGILPASPAGGTSALPATLEGAASTRVAAAGEASGAVEAGESGTLRPHNPKFVGTESPGRLLKPSLSTAFQIEIEQNVLPAGARLSGRLRGAWDAKAVYHLLWIDSAQRVAGACEVNLAPAQREPMRIELERPRGAIGRQHTLALVRAGREEMNAAQRKGATPRFKTQALASFEMAAVPVTGNEKQELAARWNDYLTVLDGGFSQWSGRSVPTGSPLCGNSASTIRCLSGLRVPTTTSDSTAPDAAPAGEPRIGQASVPAASPLALFDDDALELAAQEIRRNAAAAIAAGGAPLAWSLADGGGGDRSAPLDAGMSPATLEVFRAWLAQRYGGLEALNRQWGTAYTSWEELRPPSAEEVKAAHNPSYARLATEEGETISGLRVPATSAGVRVPAAPGGENYSAWSDTRTFCDFAFSRVLREYRTIASENFEPGQAPLAGLTGARAPAAWGGWDWSELAKNVDWIEDRDGLLPGDLLRSFSPSARLVSSYSLDEVHRLWERWLRGDNGCLLRGGNPDARPTRNNALLNEARFLGEGVTLLRDAGRREDADRPIAIYYSPRSLQLHWMLDGDGVGQVSSLSVLPTGWKPVLREANSGLRQIEAWRWLLQDLGHGARFISPEQALAGVLNNSGVKVLILPKVLSLSDAEAAALRQFALRGGVVLSDGQCGTFDGCGKRRALAPAAGTLNSALFGGALDADFGIVRRDFQALELDGHYSGDVGARVRLLDVDGTAGVPPAAAGQTPAAPRAPFGPDSDELRVLEPGLACEDLVAGTLSPHNPKFGPDHQSPATHPASVHARSDAGAAALLSKAGGLGRFVYLNLALQDYPRLRARSEDASFQFQGLSSEEYAARFGPPSGGEALRLIVADILSEIVAENPLHVRSADGVELRAVRRASFQAGGGCQLLGLLPPTPNEEGAEVKGPVWVGFRSEKSLPQGRTPPPASRHWYDLRQGLYLGFAGEVKVTLPPDRALLLSALPYKVERVSVKVRRTDPLGVFKVSANVAADTQVNELAAHVLRVEVHDPAGNVLPHYSRNVSAANGAWSTQILLGLNEPAGEYRLTVRDVLTGKTGAAALLKDADAYTNVEAP